MKAIDLFAGAGGFSTGALMAGCRVVWAANHWQSAVEVHAINHPGAQHVCQDLHQARWQDVPEFLKWSLFPAWKMALESLGYSLAPHIIDAADHGTPQHRERMFLVLSRSKAPMALRLPKREHIPAASFVDFSAGRWQPIDKPGRAPATLARIAAGRRVHGRRFISSYYGNEKGGRSIHRPIGTITTRDRHAVIDGDRMRMLSVPEARAAMGFPDDYVLPDNQRTAMHMLGNAVCPPVARDVVTAILEAA